MEKQLIRPVKIITLLFVAVFLITQCKIPTNELSEDSFFNPSTENRPLALWPWLNGYVDTTKMVYELEEMKNKGMRGAVIWDIGSLADPEKMIPEGPAFLGDKSLEYISLALKTAGKLGLDLGMVASSSWNAGGEWVEKADASKQLLSTSQMVEGPSKERITIGIPKRGRGAVNTYSLITSMAIPYSDSKVIDYARDKIIRLDKFTSEDKFIEWEVPEGM